MSISGTMSGKIRSTLIGAFMLMPMPALAQGAFDMGMLTNSLSQGALVQSEDARAGSQRLLRSAVRAPRAVPVNPAIVVYTPSLDARKRNMAAFVDRLRKADPAGAADLERMFARRDLIAEMGELMRPVGLDPRNVADAMALYLVTAYYGVRGSTDSKPSEFKAVSAQLTRAIGADATFARASDAAKQEIAESMLLQAALADQAVEAARKQPSAMPAIKAAIGKGARAAFGFDMTRMRLGPGGLS